MASESHHPPWKGDLPLHPAITPPLMTSLKEVYEKNKQVHYANDADLGKALGSTRRALSALKEAPKSLLDVLIIPLEP